MWCSGPNDFSCVYLWAWLMGHSSAWAQWIIPEFLKVELNIPVNIDEDWCTELKNTFGRSWTSVLSQSQERQLCLRGNGLLFAGRIWKNVTPDLSRKNLLNAKWYGRSSASTVITWWCVPMQEILFCSLTARTTVRLPLVAGRKSQDFACMQSDIWLRKKYRAFILSTQLRRLAKVEIFSESHYHLIFWVVWQCIVCSNKKPPGGSRHLITSAGFCLGRTCWSFLLWTAVSRLSHTTKRF